MRLYRELGSFVGADVEVAREEELWIVVAVEVREEQMMTVGRVGDSLYPQTGGEIFRLSLLQPVEIQHLGKAWSW